MIANQLIYFGFLNNLLKVLLKNYPKTRNGKKIPPAHWTNCLGKQKKKYIVRVKLFIPFSWTLLIAVNYKLISSEKHDIKKPYKIDLVSNYEKIINLQQFKSSIARKKRAKPYLPFCNCRLLCRGIWTDLKFYWK